MVRFVCQSRVDLLHSGASCTSNCCEKLSPGKMQTEMKVRNTKYYEFQALNNKLGVSRVPLHYESNC